MILSPVSFSNDFINSLLFGKLLYKNREMKNSRENLVNINKIKNKITIHTKVHHEKIKAAESDALEKK